MSAEAAVSSPDPTMPPPTLPFVTADRSISRPLSEITDNSDKRRSTARSLKGDKGEKTSRPNSEVRDSEPAKRLSSTISLQTITVNLVDYAAVVAKGPTSISSSASAASSLASPIIKPVPVRAEKPVGTSSSLVLTGSVREEKVKEGEVAKKAEAKEDEESSSRDGISSLFMAKRASLRPSPLGATYADVAKPIPSPTLSTASQSSFDSASSTAEFPGNPSTKSKSSWLTRASGTAALRSKSKSPAPKEEGTLSPSTSLPPVLPPRKGGLMATAESIEQPEKVEASTSMLPPEVPVKTSYATVAAAGPSRSRLGAGQGRPAFSPPSGPPLPSRENAGNIRGRLAAWTAAAQSTSSFSRSLSRSDSSSSIASTSHPSSFVQTQQRIPSSAQRVLGHAGSAVQKGWAGLRARGVGGSISGMSSLNPSGRRGSLEPTGTWNAGLPRGGSRDRVQSADFSMRPSASDGPIFQEDVILRAGGDRTGRVFGRDLNEAGRTWGVADTSMLEEGENDWDRGRRQCLPALVVRAVAYLEVWGPKEEGIFRISGRSSHIARLRKEFDAGADLDLKQCHPGDLDPHAVSSIFKSYLRELPSPLLTTELTPKFDAYVEARRKVPMVVDGEAPRADHGDGPDGVVEDLPSLLKQLPSAHWFLLADVVKLLDLIPRYRQVNRMTLNAVMLSLGPSLNIPGGILTELLEKREALFVSPPALTGTDSANSLIDFGSTSITPPHLPAVLDEQHDSPASEKVDDVVQTPPGKTKRSPRLPNKPSITRLFSSASGLISKKSSVNTMRSDTTPPRADLPKPTASRLGSFEGKKEDEQAVEQLKEDDGSAKAGEENFGEEHVPAGTVEARSRFFSTPIADMYQNTGSPFPSLRSQKSALGLADTMAHIPSVMSESQIPRLAEVYVANASPPANPATFIRRGPPVFFSSSGATERHGRSLSGGPIGVKRKDDSPPLSIHSSGSEGIDPSRVKRLSAGSRPVRW